MTRAFDDNFQLNSNYTFFDDRWSIDTRATKVYLKNYAYRYETPDRTIEKDIYSAGACIMACVAEKDFLCKELDYFRADGGVCALYDTIGNYGDSRHPLFVGNSASSDHYRIYRGRDTPPPCNVTGNTNLPSNPALFKLKKSLFLCCYYSIPVPVHHEFGIYTKMP